MGKFPHKLLAAGVSATARKKREAGCSVSQFVTEGCTCVVRLFCGLCRLAKPAKDAERHVWAIGVGIEREREMKTFALVAGLVGFAAAAQATTVQLHRTNFSNGNGGEFSAVLSGAAFTPLSFGGDGQFETFCLEESETFQAGATYWVTFDTFADGGGNSGQVGSTDPLSEQTAYLYRLFITGNLVGYDYANANGDRQSDNGALQRAFWFLEDEVGSLNSAQANNFRNQALAGIGQGLGDVRVMNLYSTGGNGEVRKHQSQLVTIPAPASVCGLLGLVALRRRR